jgi:hypothetical protein
MKYSNVCMHIQYVMYFKNGLWPSYSFYDNCEVNFVILQFEHFYHCNTKIPMLVLVCLCALDSLKMVPKHVVIILCVTYDFSIFYKVVQI